MDTTEIIWTILIIVFLVVEGATAGLTSIWFAAGALAGLVISLLNIDVGWQIAAFVIVSAVSVIITRPLAKKNNKNTVFTNADRVIGQTGIVIEDIDNIKGTGTVKANGKIWTARSEDDKSITAGTLVTGVSIVGVTLIVSSIESKVKTAQ